MIYHPWHNCYIFFWSGSWNRREKSFNFKSPCTDKTIYCRFTESTESSVW